MLVEHTFVTVLEMEDAFASAGDFLTSIGFDPAQPEPPKAMHARRGLPKAGRGNRVSAHPQRLRLEFDRGRINMGASVEVAGKPRPTHRAMLLSLAQGLELLLAARAAPEEARRPVEAAQREIIREHRRQRLVHNTIAAVFALIFFAVVGALAWSFMTH